MKKQQRAKTAATIQTQEYKQAQKKVNTKKLHQHKSQWNYGNNETKRKS